MLLSSPSFLLGVASSKFTRAKRAPAASSCGDQALGTATRWSQPSEAAHWVLTCLVIKRVCKNELLYYYILYQLYTIIVFKYLNQGVCFLIHVHIFIFCNFVVQFCHFYQFLFIFQVIILVIQFISVSCQDKNRCFLYIRRVFYSQATGREHTSAHGT